MWDTVTFLFLISFYWSIVVLLLLLLLLLSQSVVSDSVRPHRRQPTRLPHPWGSPGKNTGVGCHFLLQCMRVKSESEVAQSCLTLSDPMDCSLPGSSVHGIFQARVLEWGAIAFSDSCFTMLCESLLYGKANQLYVHTYPLFFGFPSHLGHHRALSRVP